VAFAVTVDLVVLTIREERLCVLLVRRGIPPFIGRLALPGGFVLANEGLTEAAIRELAEETGLGSESVHLEQLGSYGDPDRDPRQRVVTVVYLALAPSLPPPRGGGDAASAEFLPVDDLGPLAFDHDKILADGVERARAKLEYSPLATAFCPAIFTVAELRRVYEIVWGVALDPRNFHRKVTGTPDFLELTGEVTTPERGRPAQVYRPGKTTALYPPMLRP
jgi:8-oxo-dGTP diphosphatase